MKKLVTLLLTAIAFSVCAAERPVVKIEAGSLQGVVEYNMQVLKTFRMRLLHWVICPQPTTPWQGTPDASQFGDSCPQPYVKNLSAGLALQMGQA